MKYISTRNKKTQVSFHTALVNGLAPDGGLYVPIKIPKLPAGFLEEMHSIPDEEISFQVLKPFVGDDIPDSTLAKIVRQTINFEIPLVEIGPDKFALELFHGPTHAFKDVGARFMAKCLDHFKNDGSTKTVLVATSGDTGSAVANGFHNIKGTEVVVLFPKGGVSPFQEYQMTGLGGNIKAVEVNGTFDDCQRLVKMALGDEEIGEYKRLSSANSINIARLLPQSIYYFYAMKQLGPEATNVVFSVPSGNFGNLTGGLLAQKMGLNIHRFIAATNANKVFPNYLQSGLFKPEPSVATIANAMDVGNPSNFERIMHFFDQDHSQITQAIDGYSYTDEETIKTIREVNNSKGYILDPHGAIGFQALANLEEGETGVFLETAHPKKFDKAVIAAIPDYEFKFEIGKMGTKIQLSNNYDDFKNLLLDSQL